MNKKDNYRLTELKEKSKQILEEEAKTQGIEINITPITLVEYCQSDVFKQKTILKKIKTKFTLTNAGGFFDSETSQIVIFIDRMGYNEKLNSHNKLSAVIFATYHEYKHQLQLLGKYLTKGQKFIIELERYLVSIYPQDYKKRHNKYLMEIDANLYAVKRTYEYMLKNNPDKLNQTKIYLDDWLTISIHNKINYDSQKTFDNFYRICKHENYQINQLNIPNIKLFIEDNNEFKPLRKIIKAYQKDKTIDELTLLTILGSKSYLKQLDIQSLNQEEKQFILNIINKILENEINRINQNIRYYEGRKNKNKQYLKSIKTINDKIKFLNNEIIRLTTYKLKTLTDKIPNQHYKNLKKIKNNLEPTIIIENQNKDQTKKR